MGEFSLLQGIATFTVADITRGSRVDRREKAVDLLLLWHTVRKPSSSQSVNKIPGLDGTNNVVKSK